LNDQAIRYHGGVGDPNATTEPEQAEAGLDSEELEAWKALVLITQLLPGALDRQLQAEVGLPHSDFAVLAALSSAPGCRLRMTDLAAVVDYSLSRLSHAMNRIEKEQWVRREPCKNDKRVYFAVLTARGEAMLAHAAPGHVAHVRRIVFDHLTRAQIRQLRNIGERILPQLAPGQGCETGGA